MVMSPPSSPLESLQDNTKNGEADGGDECGDKSLRQLK